MATEAHCAFCFETLAADFEGRQPLSLREVERLWTQYHASTDKADAPDDEDDEDDEDDAEMTDADTEEAATAKPAAISRLLSRVGAPASASSKSSIRSTRSSTSSSQSGSKDASGIATPASSKSSMSSNSSLASSMKRKVSTVEEYPLFVTWNTLSRNGHKSLRGCIGTFAAQKLEHGLRSYALTSAFEDSRFHPIPQSLLPSLSAHVTLLTDFSAPKKDPMDWRLGKNGLRISFTVHGRRLGSTYLPDVAKEQGWTQEETLISLMRKAGWNGSSSSWSKVWKDGGGELITYEGKQVGLTYNAWRRWRDWVEKAGITSTASN